MLAFRASLRHILEACAALSLRLAVAKDRTCFNSFLLSPFGETLRDLAEVAAGRISGPRRRRTAHKRYGGSKTPPICALQLAWRKHLLEMIIHPAAMEHGPSKEVGTVHSRFRRDTKECASTANSCQLHLWRPDSSTAVDSLFLAEAQQQTAELERMNKELKDSLADERTLQETLASLEAHAAKLREETSKAREGKATAFHQEGALQAEMTALPERTCGSPPSNGQAASCTSYICHSVVWLGQVGGAGPSQLCAGKHGLCIWDCLSLHAHAEVEDEARVKDEARQAVRAEILKYREALGLRFVRIEGAGLCPTYLSVEIEIPSHCSAPSIVLTSATASTPGYLPGTLLVHAQSSRNWLGPVSARSLRAEEAVRVMYTFIDPLEPQKEFSYHFHTTKDKTFLGEHDGYLL